MIKARNFNNRALVNARNSSAALKDIANETVTIKGAALDAQADTETGECKTVAYIVKNDGAVYGTISGTAVRAVDGIIDVMNDENLDALTVKVEMRKSNAGRNFITLTIVD